VDAKKKKKKSPKDDRQEPLQCAHVEPQARRPKGLDDSHPKRQTK
jgi:hypothetical protein